MKEGRGWGEWAHTEERRGEGRRDRSGREKGEESTAGAGLVAADVRR